MRPILRRAVATISAIVLLAGCTLPPAQSPLLVDYPYRHEGFDAHIVWRTVMGSEGLMLEGAMKNVRFAYMDWPEITVKLKNGAGKTLAEATDFPLPRPVRRDDYCNFSLFLKNVTVSPGDDLHFVIQYRAIEGSSDSFSWISRFTVDAMTGTGESGLQ